MTEKFKQFEEEVKTYETPEDFEEYLLNNPPNEIADRAAFDVLYEQNIRSDFAKQMMAQNKKVLQLLKKHRPELHEKITAELKKRKKKKKKS